MKNNHKSEENQQDQIIELGSDVTKSKDGKIYTLTIIGQVEGHQVLPENCKTTKYEHLIPELIAVEENPDIKGLLLILNTVGGDVEAGLALAELIAGISKPTVSLVIGGGHSIGIPLAVSQITCMDSPELMKRRNEFLPLMEETAKKKGFSMAFLCRDQKADPCRRDRQDDHPFHR